MFWVRGPPFPSASSPFLLTSPRLAQAYFGFTVLLEGILILTTIFHLRELRRTMSDLRGRAQQSVEARAQGEMIESGYRSLRNITAAVIACCTCVLSPPLPPAPVPLLRSPSHSSPASPARVER